jgi:hypothetical protein
MKKTARRLIRRLALYVLLPLVGILGIYGWLVKGRLDATLESDGVGSYSLQWSLISPERSEVKTRHPFVVRVSVKRKDGANWLPGPRGDLVHGTYDWSPGGHQWVVVPPPSEAAAKALELRRFALATPGDLIERLADPDPHIREVAVTLLRLWTKQDFGYRYDLDPDTQAEAIAAWRGWWAKNKAEWYSRTILEGVEKVLEKP